MSSPTQSTLFLANGDSLAVQVNGATWIHIEGTFNSGTVALTFKDANGATRAIRDSTGTAVAYAAGADDFYNFPSNVAITLTLSGAAGATSIFVQIQSEPRR